MIAATGAVEVGPRGHVVQFYREHEELADRVGAFLAEALDAGGRAIAIATAAHRRGFEARLAAAGIDVAAARARDDYLAVDAEQMLRRLMIDGALDAGSFDHAVGSLIEGSGRPGRGVRVYGELVAILWRVGRVAEAIELEEMWIGLGRRHPFGLWCGYPAEQPADGTAAEGLAEVCRLHDEIFGRIPAGCVKQGGSARLGKTSRDFAGSLDSVGSARRFVVAALEAGGYGAVADDAALVVTELAANAVVHARSDFTVTITPAQDRVRIDVHDRAALPATGGGPVLPAEPLHGLGAVAALAVRWGASPDSSGKDVWAELPR